MDKLGEFLDAVRTGGTATGHFRGLLHILVGRRIVGPDGAVISAGMTWRVVATLLKRLRWDREAVRELGLDPAALPPRDRERFWYLAISRANIASPESQTEAEAITQAVRSLGYTIGPPPGTGETPTAGATED